MAKNLDQTKTVALIVAAVVALIAVVGILLRNSPSSSTPAGQQTGPSSLAATDDNGDKWVLELAQGPPLYNSSDSNVRAGAPLLIKTDVQIIGRDVSIGLIVEGRAGETYVPGVQKNGQWQPAPGLKIVDEAGSTLGTGKFKYGWGGTCRYSWRVPDDFTGKFRVQVDIDLGPFETKAEETWHSI